MAAKLFIFVGHPSETSLSHGMADAYQRGAESEGAEVRRMNLHDMAFDPDLTHGYNKRKDLEPCLEEWREHITWCSHMCWVYPQWWGGMPAKMKGVIDRAFLPGFAMNYHEKGPFWDRLLKGRSADVIMTSDTPLFFDVLRHGRPGIKLVKNKIMDYSGIKPVRTLQVGPVKSATEEKIQSWVRKAYNRGADAGRR
jgi:putative NADPH-quinone reductase